VTVVSAPAGSGKTVLLRSWIGAAGLAERAAWVPVGRDERDPQRLWLTVLDALRQTALGSALVRPVTAAPDLDGWAIIERLLTDLEPLRDELWLVVDDAHELDSDQAQRQLELLVMRAPERLRFVLATRRDMRMGLHHAAEAIRHALAAQNWALASSLVAEHWLGLYLDGRSATVHALMSAFPAGAASADAELAAAAAGDELAQGSLAAAERYLALAESPSAPKADAERGSGSVLLDVVRLLMVEQTGDQRARGTLARRLLAAAGSLEAAQPSLGAELRALALISLGDSETWTGDPAQAEAHLDQAVALARRIGRPYLEFMALIYRGVVELTRQIPLAAGPSRQAIELAERHGWSDDPFAGLAYMTFGSALAWQGRLDEADAWVHRAERTIDAEDRPVVAMGIKYLRGQLELGRGQPAAALSAFEAGEPLGGAHPLVRPLRAWLAIALVRLGELDRAERLIAGVPESRRVRGEMRIAAAMLYLVRDDPEGATVALAPVLSGSAQPGWRSWLTEGFLLEAAARDALGDPTASGRALERALDLAEADRALLWFLLHPVPGLLASHARQGTGHGPLIAEILDLLAVTERTAGPGQVREPLSKSELRVLRYLPTHLSAPEIAAELYVSTSTVKTHMRNLYTKLGAHSRTEVVASARSLGLLAPSASVERT
jgi:LuxR family transcriptional regulator, maltose regulon positive regulatory protein